MRVGFGGVILASWAEGWERGVNKAVLMFQEPTFVEEENKIILEFVGDRELGVVEEGGVVCLGEVV